MVYILLPILIIFIEWSFELGISISVYIFNRKDHVNLVKGNTWSPYNLQFLLVERVTVETIILLFIGIVHLVLHY